MEFCRRIFGAGERKSACIYTLGMTFSLFSRELGAACLKLSPCRSAQPRLCKHDRGLRLEDANFVGNLNVRRRRHACNTTP